MLIRKLFKAEMAHATIGAYTTRCHHLHGHSYRFELFLRSERPNRAQMVSDFKAVKDIGINDFFDSFDHAVMLWEKDARLGVLGQINPDRHIVVPFNPTAEMMAKNFFTIVQAIVDVMPGLSGEDGYRVARVMVHETDTGYALYDESDAETDRFEVFGLDRWKFSEGIKSVWNNKDWFPRVLDRLKTPR